MFLKRLEINGFKSFANKTTLDFSFSQDGIRGITAIVGPNGSGKSNIADAIRWVMGEQSMKNLRGKKSEDIIFAGSGKKARLGSAQASLFFDNSDKKIPLEFTEVSITRKVFRSGEGEYLVNGSRVRLQDIVDLLAKAGIGKESYSIVNQGMADAILNATPAERRIFIEDAAGVKQYQIKKDRSMRKLELTRDNLKRVRELTEEIKPHLKMLKRQAERASQSEEVARELREKQILLFGHLWSSFQDEKRALNGKKDEIGIRMMNIQREVDKLTDEIGAHSKEQEDNTRQSELEQRIIQKRTQLNQAEKDLVICEGRVEIEKEKQKSLEAIEQIRIENIAVDINYAKHEIESIESEQGRLVEMIEKAATPEDLQSIRSLARDIWQKILELKTDIEKGKKEKKEERIVSGPAPEVLAANEKIVELQKKASEIREGIVGIRSEMAQLERDLQEEIEGDRQKRKEFFEAERKLRIKQEEFSRIKDEFNELKISLAKIEVREDDLRSEVREGLRIEPENLEREERDIDQPSLEREISRLKVKMEQVGGIDPLIIDEYNETQKRFDFLSTESDDLEKAIVSLKEVIKEMEQKIEESFASTFEEINKEFIKYFRIIFGGGNAHLIKSKIKNQRAKNKKLAGEDSENGEVEEVVENVEEEKEEVGIDLFACPPGKKIHNLSMLSGGERSLTSLALLFAIISHNPPPFSILDEVEAALDEANSKRFGRIIQELSGNTQFVIITHNRESMRQASLLYGVTMGEDGISKLLSVHLDQVGQGGKIKE